MIFRAHSNASHTAMATRPAKASAISDAVMSATSPGQEINMRHDHLGDHFGREPYLQPMEAACGRGLSPRPRTGTFARAGEIRIRFGRRPACDASGSIAWEDVAP
jgi:hypothetical protein